MSSSPEDQTLENLERPSDPEPHRPDSKELRWESLSEEERVALEAYIEEALRPIIDYDAPTDLLPGKELWVEEQLQAQSDAMEAELGESGRGSGRDELGGWDDGK